MTKQEKHRPEVAVAREYFTLTYHAWWLNHNGYKFGMTDMQIDKELADLRPHIAKSMAEGQERFVDPQQKTIAKRIAILALANGIVVGVISFIKWKNKIMTSSHN